MLTRKKVAALAILSIALACGTTFAYNFMSNQISSSIQATNANVTISWNIPTAPVISTSNNFVINVTNPMSKVAWNGVSCVVTVSGTNSTGDLSMVISGNPISFTANSNGLTGVSYLGVIPANGTTTLPCSLIVNTNETLTITAQLTS